MDFYAKLDDKAVLVNVSCEIKDEKTRVRKINGLAEAMEYLNISEATLITKEGEGLAEAAGKKIFIVPLYKHLLAR